MIVRMKKGVENIIISLFMIVIGFWFVQITSQFFSTTKVSINGGVNLGFNYGVSNDVLTDKGIMIIILNLIIIFFTIALLTGILGLFLNNGKQTITSLSQPTMNSSNEEQDRKEANYQDNIQKKEVQCFHNQHSVKSITVTAHNLTFEPKIIRVNKGTRVNLTFKNEEEVVNNFVIQGINVQTEVLNPKTEQTIEFIAETKGEYNTVSSVSNISSRSGKFIIE